MKDIQWVYIPPFSHASVSGVTFGGFMVSRFIASQPNSFNGASGDNPDVADSAAVGNVPAFSVAGKPAWRYITYWEARKAAANANVIDGPGVHLLTAFEWASLAMLCDKYGIHPHGNNNNNALCNDVTYTAEKAAPDRAALARNAAWYASLVGTGPATWNILHHPNGPADMNGNMWEWIMGFHMQTLDEAGHDGHAMVLATLDVALTTAPYGRSTSTGTNTLTDTDKAWTVNAFTAGGAVGQECYMIDSAGTRFTISSNTADTITVSSGNPAAGPYEIVIDTGTDITVGCTTDNDIATLKNADAELKGFACPDTTAASNASYGNDHFWFNTADPGDAPNNIRTAIRGGAWSHGAGAGVFALYLSSAPDNSNNNIGFRLGKSL